MDVLDAVPRDSWFHDYIKCYPLAEPPKSYLLFSAMSTLGACLGRRVWYDADVHMLFPMLNLLLIGPSGIGKSTALGMSKKLLAYCPEHMRPQVISGKATKERLHEDLCINPHAIVLASELANMFSKEKYNEGQIPYFTQLLDYENEISIRTKSGSLQTIRKPSVTVQGGSTVEWLQEQLPSTAAAGGFLPRFFIVKENHKGQKVPDPKLALSRQKEIELEQLREKVFQEFRHILSIHEGRMGYADFEAADAYGIWYQLHQPDNGHLSPFAARAGEYVRRLAMLVALSCFRDSLAAEDIRAGIKLYEYSSKKLQEVVIPFSPAGKLAAKILEIIGNDEVSVTTIKRGMRNYIGSREVDRILQDLTESKDITHKDGYYRKVRH